MTDCIFCKIIAGEIPGQFVYRDDEIVVFRDINPAAPVHLLITPRKHIASNTEATSADEALLGKMFTVARNLATEQGLNTSGYRLIINTGAGAGQTVLHLHMHLIAGKPMGERLL
jgi:histidine triad (HIT) family protein